MECINHRDATFRVIEHSYSRPAGAGPKLSLAGTDQCQLMSLDREILRSENDSMIVMKAAMKVGPI